MSAQTERIIVDLAGAIKDLGKSKTSAFDSKAVIRRIENSVAWVHFEGGEEETPADLTVNAKVGDEVQVRVSNGRAFLVGNATSPPTDDTMAIIADANARVARLAAEDAIEDAARAEYAANSAQASADAAYQSAGEAAESAREANDQAIQATNYANNALGQLSTVENVVDTLGWIREHGTYALTSDTEVRPGKYYFTRSGSGTTEDPYVYMLVPSPADNPSEAGYYELTGIDEAVSNYVSSHLALTNEGLFLTLDNSGYKLKLTNQGAYIIDPSGSEVAAYSSTTRIGNQNGAHMEATSDRLSFKDGDGNEIAYIAADVETGVSVFYMTQAIVVQDLFFGNWRWNSRSNGNLALKWVGSEE